MDNYSLSDIKAVTDGVDGFGGGWMWIIVLFLFLFGNGGFGRGNNNEIQQGFDTAEITRKLDGITNGICDSTYAINNSIVTEGRALQGQLANCCCETNRNIDSVRYDNAQNTQKILDAICGNRMADMQNQINMLQLQAALCGVVRYPTAITYNGGTSPFCGCGCNNI